MLTCRHCRSPLPAAAPDEVARCRACGALLDPIRGARPRVAFPRDLDVELAQGVGGRRMTLSWRAQHRGARVVVTLMLVGGLGALSRVVPAHVAWVPLAMAVVVGLVLLWDLLRRVVTVVDGNGIRRVDRPFSFGGATVLPRASVVQLYTRAERGAQSNVSVKVSSGGSSDSEAPFARTSPPTWTKSLVDAEHETVFAVRACLRDGRDLLVAGPYPQQEQALWVEQEMERILRIEDTPVDGELPRPA